MLGDMSTGASNDLQRATAIARSMVMKYGMSDRLGAISYDSDQEVFIGRSMSQARSYSEEVAGLIDEEVKKLLDQGYQRCQEILNSHREELERTAEYLLEFETMSAEDFALVFDDPEALELRKAEEREEREKRAQVEAQERERMKAQWEEETAKRLRAADELIKDHVQLPPLDEEPPAKDSKDDQPPDPF